MNRILILLVLLLIPATALADEALRARFMSEYPRACREIEQFYQGMSMRVRESTAWTEGAEPDVIYEYEYKTSGSSELLITHVKKVPEAMKDWPVDSAVVANTRLSFSVNRPTKDGAWVLSRTTEHRRMESAINVNARGVVAPYVVHSSKVADLIHTKHFRVLDAEVVEQPRAGLVKVTFDWSDETADTDGWLLLSPKESWVLYGWLIRSNDKGKRDFADAAAEIEYQPSGEKLPWLKRAHYWVDAHRFAEGKETVNRTTDSVFEVLEISRQNVPDKEFTLAAFNLPEPGETPSQHRRVILWCLVGGVVLIAVCVFWLTRRRAATRIA